MAKIVRTEVDSFYFQYPAGATILTSRYGGRSNVMACAWHSTFSNNPRRYGVLVFPQNMSHDLMVKSGEFVVNFIPTENADLVAMVGGCSGRDVDKFKMFQIETIPGVAVDAPVLDIAYASYECRTFERRTYGDHDLFVGDVIAVQWEETAFSGDGTLNLRQVQPAVYIGEDQYAAASQPVRHDRDTLVKAAFDRK